MILPIGDTPNPEHFTPWVTWGLIAINVLIYVLISLPLSQQGVDPTDPMLREYLQLYPAALSHELLGSLRAYDLFIYAHGYKPAAPQLSDLLSAMFLHGGLLHLAGNMLFLWIYGDNVEHRAGRLSFAVLYVLCGAGSTLAFAALAGNSMTPLVGASGAISGVLGMYFVLFPRNQIKLLIALFPFLMQVVLVPARVVLVMYVLLDNLLPLLSGSASSVAYGAHLGGFFAGLVAAVIGQRMAWSLTAPAPATPTALADLPLPVLLEQVARQSAAGHRASTTRQLLRALQQSRQDPACAARLRLALGLLRLEGRQVAAAYQDLTAAAALAPGSPAAQHAQRILARMR